MSIRIGGLVDKQALHTISRLLDIDMITGFRNDATRFDRAKVQQTFAYLIAEQESRLAEYLQEESLVTENRAQTGSEGHSLRAEHSDTATCLDK